MTPTAVDRWFAALTGSAAGPTDADLLGRFAAGRDGAAFAELVHRHGPLVLGVCRRGVPDAHLAEDAFQAVFMVLATNAGRVDPARPLAAFLHGVAVKVAARARGRLLARRRREALSGVVPDVAAGPPAYDDSTAVLDEELAKLSAAYREALVLCELEGLTRRMAAEKLGIPEGTLSSRLAAGRKALAARLMRRGVGPGAAVIGAIVSPELAGAAVRSGLGAASGIVLELSQGVLHAMLLTKLKALAVVAAAALVALPAVWPGGPTLPPVAATPPTVAVAKPPQLWLLYPKAGRLVSLHADGSVDRTVLIPDGYALLHAAPRQNKLWFHSTDGAGRTHLKQNAESLHVRGINGQGAGVDLDLELRGPALSAADGKTVLTCVIKLVQGQIEYENSLVDVATKKTTKLDHLPTTHQVMGVFPDSRSVLTLDRLRLYQTPVAGGKPCRLSDTLYASGLGGISPDGTKLLVFGAEVQTDAADNEMHAYVADVATGKSTKIGDEARLGWAYGQWSADGKRVVYTWRKWNKNDQGQIDANGVPPTRLVVRDADGKNAKTLVTSQEDFHVVAWE